MDLAAAGLLPPMPRSFLGGSDLDLLAPLRLLPAAQPAALSALAASTPPGRSAAAGRQRADLASALLATNRAYGHLNVDHACRRLADPATRVVVTGQQPGLFGGPLLTFAKMMAAARWAAALEAAGEPAVAVFWVATEDHDYAEVANATVLTADGPRSFDLGPDPQPLLPVGMRSLSPAVTEALRAMGEALPAEGHAEWLRTLARWYTPEARFGEAFCRAAAAMLGTRCPLLLDAMHPALKAAERPWLACLIERRGPLAEALARQEAAVAGRGYELRVTPQQEASPLFLLRHGQRRRIEWRGGAGYALRGETAAGPPGLLDDAAHAAGGADGAGVAGAGSV
ncbi:MAG TPA: bacillithiol biosynthesis BshC, partial [Thermoanaerobaculia bacterium]|nr:bacillithiol biosynthesis BshC [Thermoanaerobaculia bacterium]